MATIVWWVLWPTRIVAIMLGLLGFAWAGMLFHEGSHGSLSRKSWVNIAATYASYPLMSPTTWFRKHIVNHHQYTNTCLDEDVQRGPIIRHHPDVPWTPMHALQLLLVSIGSIGTLIAYEPGVITLLQFGIMYAHWWVHMDVLCAVGPICVAGAVFTQISQLNHIQSECFTRSLQKYPTDFVEHQVFSSLDYAHHSHPWLKFVVIFLNYQTYHHLFPAMSHFQLWAKSHTINRVLVTHGITPNHVSVSRLLRGYWAYMYQLCKTQSAS